MFGGRESTGGAQGFVVEADPVPRGSRWAARAVIEVRGHVGVNYQEVGDDPFVTYATREEAARASLAFGKAIVDSQVVSR
jgi:hypothetical protein